MHEGPFLWICPVHTGPRTDFRWRSDHSFHRALQDLSWANRERVHQCLQLAWPEVAAVNIDIQGIDVSHVDHQDFAFKKKTGRLELAASINTGALMAAPPQPRAHLVEAFSLGVLAVAARKYGREDEAIVSLREQLIDEGGREHWSSLDMQHALDVAYSAVDEKPKKRTKVHVILSPSSTLYRGSGNSREYFEAWCAGGEMIEHTGVVGTRGETRCSPLLDPQNADEQILASLRGALNNRFKPVDEDRMKTLLVEYPVDGFGTDEDLAHRHKLEDQLGEVLGWTGLGSVDGGSAGSGSMEVACQVIDVRLAKRVISDYLKEVSFPHAVRIYED